MLENEDNNEENEEANEEQAEQLKINNNREEINNFNNNIIKTILISVQKKIVH